MTYATDFVKVCDQLGTERSAMRLNRDLIVRPLKGYTLLQLSRVLCTMYRRIRLYDSKGIFTH